MEQLAKWLRGGFFAVITFFILVALLENCQDNVHIKQFATLEVMEQGGKKATVQLTETVENPNLAIGWMTLLVYDKKEESFVDSRVITAEQLDEMD